MCRKRELFLLVLSFSAHSTALRPGQICTFPAEEPQVLFSLLIATVRARTLSEIPTERRTYGECQVSVWSLKLVEKLITDKFLTSYCTLDNCICISYSITSLCRGRRKPSPSMSQQYGNCAITEPLIIQNSVCNYS